MISTVVDKAEKMAGAVSDAMSDITMDIQDNGIVEKAERIFKDLSGTVPDSIGTSAEFDTLRRASDSQSINLYDNAKPKDESNPQGDDAPGGSGTVNIGTIIVRNDDDVDKLSRGLYNKSKETLSGLGNIVTP